MIKNFAIIILVYLTMTSNSIFGREHARTSRQGRDFRRLEFKLNAIITKGTHTFLAQHCDDIWRSLSRLPTHENPSSVLNSLFHGQSARNES